MSAQREFDIVLYGATGFAGKLTAEYLARSGGDARIALAGRSLDKLLAVRETLGDKAQSWPLIAADASQPSTLNAMAAQAQVVVTTVGPYARYGLPLVAACAAAGTDYADLTGETLFIRESIDLYHKQALDTGARIVHSCGFDSVPSDLTVFALYRRAQEDGAGQLTDTNLVVRAMSGGVSGGTIASMMDFMNAVSSDAEARQALNDPYTLTPDHAAEPELGAQPDLRWRRGRDVADELDGYWLGAFVMAGTELPNCQAQQCITRLRVRQKVGVRRADEHGPLIGGAGCGRAGDRRQRRRHGLGGRFFNRLPRKLVDRIAPKPGTGPSERARENGHYTVETYTTTTTGARYRARLSQRGDYGYKATSVLLGECGLALANDRDRLSDLRGVLTPAAAMGDALLARFPAAEVSLETTRLN